MLVTHRYVDVHGVRTFYRAAGPMDAPIVLLPHGYPCSSYQYRNLLPALGDGWRLIAPDFPGFGYSDTPDPTTFSYSFDGYAAFLDGFAAAVNASRYALYLHDYGSQIGLRLAIRHPERVAALIIQNGDIYEDALGPKYAFLLDYFKEPTRERRAVLEQAVSEEGFRDEFLNEVRPDLAERIPPDLWRLSWALLDHPVRRNVMVRLMEGGRTGCAETRSGLLRPTARAPHAHRLGSSGWLHARDVCAGVSPRPPEGRAAPARRRTLGPGNELGGDRRARAQLPHPCARTRAENGSWLITRRIDHWESIEAMSRLAREYRRRVTVS